MNWGKGADAGGVADDSERLVIKIDKFKYVNFFYKITRYKFVYTPMYANYP